MQLYLLVRAFAAFLFYSIRRHRAPVLEGDLLGLRQSAGSVDSASACGDGEYRGVLAYLFVEVVGPLGAFVSGLDLVDKEANVA